MGTVVLLYKNLSYFIDYILDRVKDFQICHSEERSDVRISGTEVSVAVNLINMEYFGYTMSIGLYISELSVRRFPCRGSAPPRNDTFVTALYKTIQFRIPTAAPEKPVRRLPFYFFSSFIWACR